MENRSERTILVSGATGRQGGAVATHLHRAGFRVRAMTRRVEQPAARRLSAEGMEVVEADFEDRAAIERALEGVHGAFSVQTPFEEGVESEVRQGTRFAEAAAEAGVEHFVFSSVGGAERRTGIPHFESKWRIEQRIRTLGLPATVLRPVAFMDNWLSHNRGAIDLSAGTLAQPLDPDTSLQQIAADDIGAYAALAFANPDEWIGREIELAGDEPTMTDVAAIFSRVLDRRIDYVQVPWDEFRERTGDEVAAMYRWFETKGYEADIAALREVYPPLRRLEPFLREGTRDWVRRGQTRDAPAG